MCTFSGGGGFLDVPWEGGVGDYDKSITSRCLFNFENEGKEFVNFVFVIRYVYIGCLELKVTTGLVQILEFKKKTLFGDRIGRNRGGTQGGGIRMMEKIQSFGTFTLNLICKIVQNIQKSISWVN